LRLPLTQIPKRWLVILPVFLFAIVTVVVMRARAKPEGKIAEAVMTASVRLSKTILPARTAKEMNADLAVRLAQSKQYPAARKVFEEILLSEPTNVSILNNIAFVSAEMGDVPRAIEYLQTALQVSEACAECFNNLGSLLHKQGKGIEAKSNFERAVKLDPFYVDPKLNLGVLLEESSDWTGAYEWYRQAEPGIKDPELKKWVGVRIIWMSEISTANKRQIAGEK